MPAGVLHDARFVLDDAAPFRPAQYQSLPVLVDVPVTSGREERPHFGHDRQSHTTARSRAERDLDLDLDGSPARKRRNADRRAAVPTRSSEHVGEEPARAVDHRRLLCETLYTGDETEHGEHAFDPIKVSKFVVQHGERVQRAPPGSLRALLDREVEAERARVDQGALVVTRQLAEVRARPPCTITASSGSWGGYGPGNSSPSSASRR